MLKTKKEIEGETVEFGIPSISQKITKEAMASFDDYKEKGVILDCVFEDDIWRLTNQVKRISFTFSFNEIRYMEKGFEYMEYTPTEAKRFLKVFTLLRMGSTPLAQIRKDLSAF